VLAVDVEVFEFAADEVGNQGADDGINQGNPDEVAVYGDPDNPDQRIAEDIYLLADISISLFRSFINNIAKFSAFVAVLWTLSGVTE